MFGQGEWKRGAYFDVDAFAFFERCYSAIFVCGWGKRGVGFAGRHWVLINALGGRIGREAIKAIDWVNAGRVEMMVYRLGWFVLGGSESGFSNSG